MVEPNAEDAMKLRGLRSLAVLVKGRRLLGSAILHLPTTGWTIFFLVATHGTGAGSRKRKPSRKKSRLSEQSTPASAEESIGNAVWMEYTTYSFHADGTVSEEKPIPEDGLEDVEPEERHRYIAEALTIVGVHRIYAPDFGNIAYLAGTDVEKYHIRMLQRLRLLVLASHGSIQEQLAVVHEPDDEISLPRPSRLLRPADELLVAGCAMFLPYPTETQKNSKWSVWWLTAKVGIRPARWLFERQPSIAERAKWQYSLLASHQLGSTIMPPRESYLPDTSPTERENLKGTLYVNLLDVGDQSATRREGLVDRLCDILVALYKTAPSSFANGDYLEDTEKWLDEGSELGEEPT